MDRLGLRCEEEVERDGREEVGDGAIDDTDGAELVRGCEVGAGESGERESKTPGGLEVQESYRHQRMRDRTRRQTYHRWSR